MPFPCESLPEVTLPVLGGGLSIPPFNFQTPGGLLCCRFPVAKVSTPPINLGVSVGILQVMAIAIDAAEAEMQIYLDALIGLTCPFEADPDTF